METNGKAMFSQVDQKQLALRQSKPVRRDLLVAMKQRLDAEWVFHEMSVSGTPLARMDIRRMMAAPDHVVLRADVLRQAFNFHRSVRFIDKLVAKNPGDIESDLLGETHALLVRDSHLAGPTTNAQPGYRLTDPEVSEPGQAIASGAIPRAMADIFDWLRTRSGMHPIAHASRLYLRLMHVQPFAYANARLARLWSSLLLMQRGLPPALLSGCDRLPLAEAVTEARHDEGRSLEGIFALAVERGLDLCLECAAPPMVAEVPTVAAAMVAK